jgi:hypothetical protein
MATADDADAIIKRGTDLRREGRDREALEQFRQAAAIHETPRVTAQIAFAEQALGLWVEAEAHLGEALEHRSDPWIQKNLTLCENTLGVIRAHIGRIDVWGTPDSADVIINDKRVGDLPFARPVGISSEEITLVIRAPGYIDYAKVLQIKTGTLVREHVELRTTPPPPVAKADLPRLQIEPKPPVESAKGIAVAETAPPMASQNDGGYRPYGRWWLWTALGVIVAGVGTAVFLANRNGGGGSDGCTDATKCTSTWK